MSFSFGKGGTYKCTIWAFTRAGGDLLNPYSLLANWMRIYAFDCGPFDGIGLISQDLDVSEVVSKDEATHVAR